jgi:bifunctional non-homologous end joining protein LigD
MPLPGFVPPCLPIKAPQPPSGDAWVHEIKHDGFRVIARKDGERVRLYSRPGNDLTYRFPLIVEALARLRSRSCIIDGEAVCCDEDGMPSFDRIRYRRSDTSVFLYAFDLIELSGDDLRREPLEVRKATLNLSWPRLVRACGSTNTSRPTVPLCSRTPARWAWRA